MNESISDNSNYFPLDLLDYDLPKEAIAQHGVEPRDSARMLVVHRDRYSPDAPENDWIEHRKISDLPEYLEPSDIIIRNRSSVIKSRLIVTRLPGYGKGEVFILKVLEQGKALCLIRSFGKSCIKKNFEIGEYLGIVDAETCEQGIYLVSFYQGNTLANVYEIISKFGITPLPPYIHSTDNPHERYETVYAQEKGSVAAPTAGLHFTPELMEKIKAIGAEEVFVTLHVGLGTFRPVSVDNIDDHVMHREFYHVSPETAAKINAAKKAGRRIVAVGTTAVRTLEAAGESGILQSGNNWTNIFIYPGYKFRFVDALITNFHLPQSTLLMLVSTLASRDIMLSAYEIAVKEKYRFFSFGDAMFIR